MTRQEKLITMTGTTLLGIAEKLGLKVNKNTLKQGKDKLIARILEAEATQEKPATKKEEKQIFPEKIKNTGDFLNAVSDTLDGKKVARKPVKAPNSSIKAQNEVPKANTKPEPKKANMRLNEVTYKGKTKTIREWASEIDMPWPTLYDRINRNGWPVDLAIETPLGQRRPKNKED